MKILFVIGFLAPRYGGPVNNLLGLSSQIAQKGHEVTIYTTNIDGNGILDVPIDKPVLKNGVEIRYFPIQWPRYYKLSIPMIKALKERINSFDIVHIYSIYSFHTVVTSHYCRKYKMPYTMSVHGSLAPFLRKRHALRKAVYTAIIEQRYWDSASTFIFTSEEEMKLTDDLAIKAPKVVVPVGINIEEYSNLPLYGKFIEKYPLLKGKKVILFLSRINFVKGLDILAKAFGEVAHKRSDTYLVIAGPDNEGYGTDVKRWLAKEGVIDRTIFTGMLLGEDKLAAFRDSDVFVLPSYTENFGIVIIEAMACNLPVVISNRVNIWREIVEADAGIAVNCDSKELARVLLELLDDPVRCQRLGENGRKLVEERFIQDKRTDQMIKFYKDILSGKFKR